MKFQELIQNPELLSDFQFFNAVLLVIHYEMIRRPKNRLPHILSHKTDLALQSTTSIQIAKPIIDVQFLKDTKSYIGRTDECDIKLISDKISRKHAYVYYMPSFNDWVIVDNSSRNGTHINGQICNSGQPYSLKDGNFVEFGKDVVCIFKIMSNFWEMIKDKNSLEFLK